MEITVVVGNGPSFEAKVRALRYLVELAGKRILAEQDAAKAAAAAAGVLPAAQQQEGAMDEQAA